MKKADRIIINLSVYVILFMLSFALVNNFPASLFIAFLLWVTANRVFLYIMRRRKVVKLPPISQMEDSLALLGVPGQVDLFMQAIPPCFNPTKSDGGLEITVNCEKVLVFPNYKFSPTNVEDVGRFYRAAKKCGVQKVWILGRTCPRSVILFASNLDIEFQFRLSREVRKFLHGRNLLPEKITKQPKKKSPVNRRETLSQVFIKRRAKYFLLAGISTALLSLFGPLRIYYAVVAVIALSLAVVCLVRENI